MLNKQELAEFMLVMKRIATALESIDEKCEKPKSRGQQWAESTIPPKGPASSPRFSERGNAK